MPYRNVDRFAVWERALHAVEMTAGRLEGATNESVPLLQSVVDALAAYLAEALELQRTAGSSPELDAVIERMREGRAQFMAAIELGRTRRHGTAKVTMRPSDDPVIARVCLGVREVVNARATLELATGPKRRDLEPPIRADVGLAYLVVERAVSDARRFLGPEQSFEELDDAMRLLERTNEWLAKSG